MWDYSEYEFLKIEVNERIATVTLNRPDSLNAVSARSITNWKTSGSTSAPIATSTPSFSPALAAPFAPAATSGGWPRAS